MMSLTRSPIAIALLVTCACTVPPYALPQIKSKQAKAAMSKAYTPRLATAERRGIMTALRRKLDIKSHFGVSYLKVNGDWAYIQCTEVVMDGKNIQETDLSIEALLHRQKPGKRGPWAVSAIWTLPDDQVAPHGKFIEQVRKLVAERKIPKDIFPKEAVGS